MLTLLLAASIGGHIRTCVPYRAQQVYAAPVVYQQQYTYAYPYVEKTIFTAVEQVPVYSALIGDAQRGQLRLDAQTAAATSLTDQVGRLSDEVSKLRDALTRSTPPVPLPSLPPPVMPIPPGYVPPDPTPTDPFAAPGKPIPQPPVPVPPVPGPPTPAEVDPNAKAITDAAWTILSNRCAKCHTAPIKGDAVALFTGPGQRAVISAYDKLLIDQSIYSGEMPQNGKPLESDEYSAIRAWIGLDPAVTAAVKECRDKAKSALKTK